MGNRPRPVGIQWDWWEIGEGVDAAAALCLVVNNHRGILVAVTLKPDHK